jgi:hypothetical protein
MRAFWLLFVVAIFGIAGARNSFGQTFRLEQIDLVHRQLANPESDCAEAIKRGDIRFIALDRDGLNVPGAERYRGVVRANGVKFVKQPFWLFPRASDQFSFNLRARDYATRYNTALLRYLASRRSSSVGRGH